VRLVGAAAALLSIVALASCGADTKPAKSKVPVVRLWSSLPHRGPQRIQSLAVERAVRGAVFDLRHREGKYHVEYIALDSSSPGGSGWDPGVSAANARRASLDPSTFAYIGEIDSGATAVALPILNQAGILQLTPSATAVGLTTPGVGAGPGEPYQYYPSGLRTLVRLTPRDSLQGALIPVLAKSRGCRSLAVMGDGSIYGAGLGDVIESEATARGLKVTFSKTVDPRDSGYAALIHSVKAGCLVYSGEPGKAAVRVVTDAARANPHAQIIGPDALVNGAFANPAQGGISESLARRVVLVGTVGPASGYPSAGKYLLIHLGTRSGSLVAPSVVSGFAAAELAVGCQSRVPLLKGLPDRAGVLACVMGHNHVSRALGVYRALRRGDTTLHAYSLFGIKRGRIGLIMSLHAPRPLPTVDGNAATPTN